MKTIKYKGEMKKTVRDNNKNLNNNVIKNYEEKIFFLKNGCPNCNSKQIWYRKKTKNYKCRICKTIFKYNNKKYEIIEKGLIKKTKKYERMHL
jgi:ribosomal protein S27E